MLFEDLKTIHGIWRKKRFVKTSLQETAGWSLPGTWYIEGPYARHSDVTLPDELRDSIRGIRKRQTSRELVERILPPWRMHVPKTAPGKPATQCSIAYFTNGGNWKLFDLENQAIWTRSMSRKDMGPELESLKRFGASFNIPAWRTVLDDGRMWRCDQYISGPNLAHCSERERMEAVRVLLRQFAKFSLAAALNPDPDLTQDAVRTMLQSAPNSLPAVIATKFSKDLRQIGTMLKLVPAHGDLSAQNVFFHDGEPWIIDWDMAGRYEPMLYDVLYLVLREVALGRDDLFRAFLQGNFDQDIERMLTLNNLPKLHCHNLIILVHAYLVNFHRKRSAGQRDADVRNVDEFWNPLRGYFQELL